MELLPEGTLMLVSCEWNRWLLLCNPSLSKLLNENIDPDWPTNLNLLTELKNYVDDNDFLAMFRQAKYENKVYTLVAFDGIAETEELPRQQVERHRRCHCSVRYSGQENPRIQAPTPQYLIVRDLSGAQFLAASTAISL